MERQEGEKNRHHVPLRTKKKRVRHRKSLQKRRYNSMYVCNPHRNHSTIPDSKASYSKFWRLARIRRFCFHLKFNNLVHFSQLSSKISTSNPLEKWRKNKSTSVKDFDENKKELKQPYLYSFLNYYFQIGEKKLCHTNSDWIDRNEKRWKSWFNTEQTAKAISGTPWSPIIGQVS